MSITVIRNIALTVAAIVLSSCAELSYRHSFSIADDNSSWNEYTGYSQSDEFEFVAGTDTVHVVHTDYGKGLSMGPLYLPVIPIFFLRQHTDDSTWRLFVQFKSNRSPDATTPALDSAQFASLRFIVDDTITVRPNRVDGLRGFHVLEFHHDLQSITRLTIHFDGAAPRESPPTRAPLHLYRSKVLYLMHRFGS